MLDVFSEPTLVALIGLFGGILLGLAARIGRFCALGAIEDLFYGENTLRLRMWGIAIGVSIIGTFGLSATGLVDLGDTLFLSRNWNPIASIFGGLVFGYGMALAGNCGYGALARLGGGDIRSLLIVIVMGISAPCPDLAKKQNWLSYVHSSRGPDTRNALNSRSPRNTPKR